jgi:hypothetical protein
MAMQPELIRCIYCGQERPPSDEHVVQRSLGGDLTTKLVCKDCNTGFSTIDQSLAEFSILSLQRVVNAAPDAFPAYLGGNQLRIAPDGSWEEIRVTNRLQPKILPQIHLVGTESGGKKQVAFKGSDPDEMKKLIALIGNKITAGTLGEVYVKEEDRPDFRNPRIVLHRHSDLYVCAMNKTEAKDFLVLLERNWDNIRAQMEVSPLKVEQAPTGVVQVNLKLCPNDNFRAIAKIAYNLMAECKGADFVLRTEFTPLREYILGQEIINCEPATPDDVAVDRRFVQWVQGPLGGFLKTDGHSVLLGYGYPNLAAFITLYKNFHFIVKMAKIELTEFAFEGYEFSTDRTGFHHLNPLEIYQRMQP